ncbi:MAG TPA: transporter [Candidatus Baltobacteraceae bacterium]
MKCLAWILVLSILSLGAGPAGAAPKSTVAQQLQAMQRELQQLEKRNAEQQVKIDRLEHRLPALAAANRKKHSQLQPKTLVMGPMRFASSDGGAGSPTGARLVTPPAGDSNGKPTFGAPAPEQNSVKATLQEQNALFQKGFTITPQLTYTYADNRFFTLNGFLALGAIFLGNINVSRQQNNVFSPSLNVTYGATKRLQYDVTIPYLARSSTYTSAGADSSSSQASEKTIANSGLGDITVGAYYQLRQRSLSAPNVIVNAHLTIPTGQNPYGIKIAQDRANNNLSYARNLPTGSGVYSVSAGATIIKQLDPAIVFGSVGYYYNIPGHFTDISPTDGTLQPGFVAPGNAISVSIGTAFALNDRISTSFSFQDTLVASTRERVKGPWIGVPGSSVNAGMLNIGATYAVNKKVSVQTMLGIGVTHDAPSFQFSLRLPHSFP